MSRLGNIALVAALLLVVSVPLGTAQDKRPMTFMDIINIESVGNARVSPDGSSMVFTRSITDWESGKNFTDLYLVSLEEGIDSTRQMTYTAGKNETNPRWSTDSSFFLFASDRESDGSDNQLFLMRPDGGRSGPYWLDSAAAELRWIPRFMVRLPKSEVGFQHGLHSA